MPSPLLAFLPQLGLPEMVVVMGVAVLLFGKRLPEVGRSLGRGIIEFKKGLNGIGDELDLGSDLTATGTSRRYDHHGSSSSTALTGSGYSSDTAVPKFEPPTQAPVAQTND